MLPPEPHLQMFMKNGLYPKEGVKLRVSPAAQALAIYSVLAPMENAQAEEPACTALTVRRKQGIYSMHVKGNGSGRK